MKSFNPGCLKCMRITLTLTTLEIIYFHVSVRLSILTHFNFKHYSSDIQNVKSLGL